MVSVSAPDEAAVVAAASVTLGPVTLTMVSLAGIPAPEICIPTSAEVTVPVVIMTVVLALRKVPLTPAGGVGLGAHLRRTRLAVFAEYVSVSVAGLLKVAVAAVVSVAVVAPVTVAMVSPAGILEFPETTAPTSAWVNPPPVQVRSIKKKLRKT